VFNLSAFCCGVFLLCGIGKGVTEGNGFAFFALLSNLVLPSSFGFKLFFVRVVILSDKSLTAVDRVVKSYNVLSNGASKLCCFTMSINFLISSL
tara:strand:+ start:455 stop:736 length:282 start_codon:yes stop_codon:yes gene_type:complete